MNCYAKDKCPRFRFRKTSRKRVTRTRAVRIFTARRIKVEVSHG